MKLLAQIIKCAFCGMESEQNVRISSSCFGDMDLDTRPAEMGRYNFFEEIQECPHCHYCNFSIESTEAMPSAFNEDYIALTLHSEYPRLAIVKRE